MVSDVGLGAFDPAASVLAYQLIEQGTEVLIVPTTEDGTVEGWPSARGELVVFGYTDLELLILACGTAQPRERLRPVDLVRLADEAEAPVVFAVDMWRPASATQFPRADEREREPMPVAAEIELTAEVWIASLPMAPGARSAQVEMFTITPGEPVLLAYESVDDLARCCGPYQAAVSVQAEDLDEVVRQSGACGVLFDAVLADDLRHQAPVLDWTTHDLFGEPAAAGRDWRKD